MINVSVRGSDDRLLFSDAIITPLTKTLITAVETKRITGSVTSKNFLKNINNFHFVAHFMRHFLSLSRQLFPRHFCHSEYLDECREKCPDRQCFKELDVTHIERETYPEWTVYQTLSDSPSFIVLSNPSVMLADYVTLVMSCFGTWFGLSFLDFFPIQKVAIVKTLIGKKEPKTTVVKNNLKQS